MIVPIIGGVVALGATAVCWKGVTTESGTGPGGGWRIRWACWRWIAETKGPAMNAPWNRIGVFSMSKKAHAKAAAILSVVAPMPTLTGALPSRMLKVQ